MTNESRSDVGAHARATFRQLGAKLGDVQALSMRSPIVLENIS
jgi:hypothetical protein